MILPNSSAALVSTVMAGLFSIGLIGHFSQTSPLDVSGLIDGSAQKIYETEFEAVNALSSFAIATIGAVKYGLFRQASPGAIVGQGDWLFTSEEIVTSPHFEANIVRSADRIGAVVSALAEKGIRVLPVIVPDKAEIYQTSLGFERPRQIRLRQNILQTELWKSGVRFLDARTPLKSAKSKGNVFMPDDTHWSPLGSRSVATAVAVALYGVDLQSAMVTTQAKDKVPFEGDLLRYIPTGFYRPWFGPKQQTISRYQTDVQVETGLFGDAQIEVVLVGTSFSAKPDWHFEGFLKQALQADIVNFAQLGRGPFAPMDAFLASEFLQSTPPKVVIWEIPARYVSQEETQ